MRRTFHEHFQKSLSHTILPHNAVHAEYEYDGAQLDLDSIRVSCALCPSYNITRDTQ